jgi:hypothetical protein
LLREHQDYVSPGEGWARKSQLIAQASLRSAEKSVVGTPDRLGELIVSGKCTFIYSTNRGKSGLTRSSRSSGMICSTGATIASKTSLVAVDRTEVEADNDDGQPPTRGKKQPKSSTALPSTEATTTSPGGLNIGVVFNTSDK